jgi:[ribosomal protein S5]-alanine N-acetyltransferase
MYKTLQTDRLLIRPIALTDAEFILKLVNAEGWLKYIGNRNIAHVLDAEKYIQKILNNELFFYSVIELKESNIPIGIVTFLNRPQHQHPDIGFALLPNFEKQGYAFEACKTYLDEVLKTNEYENILGITLPNNQKSIQLLEKLGLHYVRNYQDANQVLSLYSLKKM